MKTMKASVVLTLYQTISRNLPSVLKLHFSVTVSPTTTGGKGSIVTVKYPAEHKEVWLKQYSATYTHLYSWPDGSVVIQSSVYLTDRVNNLFKATQITKLLDVTNPPPPKQKEKKENPSVMCKDELIPLIKT